jgi:hypothetical protein
MSCAAAGVARSARKPKLLPVRMSIEGVLLSTVQVQVTKSRTSIEASNDRHLVEFRNDLLEENRDMLRT